MLGPLGERVSPGSTGRNKDSAEAACFVFVTFYWHRFHFFTGEQPTPSTETSGEAYSGQGSRQAQRRGRGMGQGLQGAPSRMEGGHQDRWLGLVWSSPQTGEDDLTGVLV